MTRGTRMLIATIAVLIGAAVLSALPASASQQRAVDPATIPPTSLRLPDSALPAGSVIDHDAVSDNPDADGNTTPPDKQVSRVHAVHHNFYEVLGRITGYREDFRFTFGDVEMGTEYMASIYPDAAKAQGAIDDVIGPFNIIEYVLGGKKLDPPCQTGDVCAAFSGPNPIHPGYDAVFALFRDGPIVVETGSEIPHANFAAVKAQAQTLLYDLMKVADTQIKAALNGSASNTTATPPSPTVQPTTTPPPPPAAGKKCPKNSSKKGKKCVCKKGYTMKKGKCVKKTKM